MTLKLFQAVSIQFSPFHKPKQTEYLYSQLHFETYFCETMLPAALDHQYMKHTETYIHARELKNKRIG